MAKRSIASLSEAVEVYCPPGTFFMGSANHEDEEPPEYLNNRGSVRKVTLRRGFFMMETPVTQQMWWGLMGENASPSVASPPQSKANLPFRASWCEAIAFCNALSRAEGFEEAYLLSDVHARYGELGFFCKADWKGWDSLGYRLPTEAEWEYVYRVGGGLSAWESALANGISLCGEEDPVGQVQANAWGVRDLGSLLYEWCYDGWESRLPAGEVTDPVMYGWSFYEGYKTTRGINKDGKPTEEALRCHIYFSTPACGFRCVRSVLGR